MRTPTLIAIAGALSLGACGSTSLTGDKTGAGGAGTGGVATGGSSAGGSGGTLAALCSSLEDQYQSALGAAKFCDVGTTTSCALQVDSALRGCGSCPTFVTDASKLNALRQTYDQAGCTKLPAPPCLDGACLPANNNVCVSLDGGSQGYCSPVPDDRHGGTGGTSGTGGTGGNGGDAGVPSCGELARQYTAALAAAKSCDVGAANQCQKAVSASLASCSTSCIDYVNDPTQLTVIQKQWQAAGCVVPVLCPAIACLTPVGSFCTANDAGGASCVAAYPVGVTAP